MSAELEYMFRHALVCEGSYQLLPPAERASLHRLALELVPVDPSEPDASAAELARHAGLAQVHGHEDPELRDRECEWLMLAGRRAAIQWDFRRALAHYARVLEREAHNEDRRLKAFVGVAGTQMNMGNRAAARSMVVEGVELAARAGATGPESMLRRMLGELLMEKGDLEAAFANANRAFEAAVIVGDHAGRVQAGLLIARVHSARQQPDAALALLRRLYTEATPQQGQSQVANGIGVFFARRHRNTEAREWLETAATIADHAGSSHDRAIALGNLGNVLDYLGETRQSESAYREALRIHQENGAYSWAALQVWNLGLFHKNRASPELALPLLQQATALFTELGQTEYVCQCKSGLAGTLFSLGRVPESVAIIETGVIGVAEVPVSEFTVDSQALLGDWALMRGDLPAARSTLETLRVMEGKIGESISSPVLALRMDLCGGVRDEQGLARRIAEVREQSFTHDGRLYEFAPLLVRQDEQSLRQARVFRGFLVEELPPGLRRFLAQWIRQNQPDEVERMQQAEPEVWSALAGGA